MSLLFLGFAVFSESHTFYPKYHAKTIFPFFTDNTMVNKACDFCDNKYRKNKEVGYFQVTKSMRNALGFVNTDGVQMDYICGIHFSEECFFEDGKLRPNSIPTFFPSRAAAQHDHSYHQPVSPADASYDGGMLHE